MPFYAVAKGKIPGVYQDWDTAKAQVNGYPNARYKKFSTMAEALAFNQAYVISSSTTTTTKRSREDSKDLDDPVSKRMKSSIPYYAVASGQKPGIVRTWPEVLALTQGQVNPIYRRFTTSAEALAFLTENHAQRRIQRGGLETPEPESPDALVAFTDGSALNNGRRGCRAGYACIFPHSPEWNVAKKMSGTGCSLTNNRAEYLAALEALHRANVEDAQARRVLYVFSDSMLLIRSMTEWIENWQRQGWRKKNGTPVMNADILKRLVQAAGDRRIIWRHVKAHTNKQGWQFRQNDQADRLAKEAACGQVDLGQSLI